MIALDPTIEALADAAARLGPPQPLRFVNAQALALAIAAFCGLAFLAASAQPAYQATQASAAGARHLAISEGVRRAPRRPTAAERAQAEAAKWGFAR